MFPVNVSMCSMYTIFGYAFNIMLWILITVCVEEDDISGDLYTSGSEGAFLKYSSPMHAK